MTVGYERARGMRKKHEHVDGFTVNASRTLAGAMEQAYAMFADEKRHAGWLEPGLFTERSFTANKVWRCESVSDKSRVEVRFTAKSAGKTSIALEHAKLQVEADVDLWRAFQKARLDRLHGLLTSVTA